MAKRSRSDFRSPNFSALLEDSDWLTIIAALLKDSGRDARLLANRLLTRTKHGRQVRLIRMIRKEHPTIGKMALLLRVSRRTVFRYLKNLERYGVKLQIRPDFTYRIDDIPKRLQPIVLTRDAI